MCHEKTSFEGALAIRVERSKVSTTGSMMSLILDKQNVRGATFEVKNR
ncbi:MAG: hypothetical protein WB988_06120 [Candidatus Nitrosopolaris sp.]